MLFYKLSKNTVLENIKDGGLALVVPQRRLVELNRTAGEIVGLLDGSTALDDVAVAIAQNHDIPMAQITQDIGDLIAELDQSGVIELQSELKESADMKTSDAVYFLRNTDVVLREEDQDGALLFNPDTNRVEVLNSTGLFIWKQCADARTLEEIVAGVKKAFDDVPESQVAEDVQKFIEGMLASGFIGKVEGRKK
jgi:hypothetical protein